MAEIKLAQLPDRTPVKLTIMITPTLHANLARYSDAYEAAYGRRETPADLVPFMLDSFLASDRSFNRGRKK